MGIHVSTHAECYIRNCVRINSFNESTHIPAAAATCLVNTYLNTHLFSVDSKRINCVYTQTIPHPKIFGVGSWRRLGNTQILIYVSTISIVLDFEVDARPQHLSAHLRRYVEKTPAESLDILILPSHSGCSPYSLNFADTYI